MNLDQQMKTRPVIALGAVIALALGFSVVNKSDASSHASTKTIKRASGGPGATGATGGGEGRAGPRGCRRGHGEQVTGSAAIKARAAAEAKVGGTARRVMKGPRGSGYVVFVQTKDGPPTAVELTSDFKVTATHDMQGPPGGGRGGPPPDAPPHDMKGDTSN